MRRAGPPYNFTLGLAPDLGVGVTDMAVTGIAAPMAAGFFHHAYAVQRSIDPTANALSVPVQQVPLDDLLANGFFLSGTLALAELSAKDKG